MKKVVTLAAALLLAASLGAQAQLTKSDKLPSPDGTVTSGEYQYTTTVSGMTIGATLGTDGKLYLSNSVKTSGWVALGVGGTKMDGSRLFLAYDSGGKQSFTEQIGAGHSHSDAATKVVEKWAVKTANGVTTLELVLPAKAVVTDGKLGLLYSYSDTTSYSTRHQARGSMTLSVAL
jgi:hypothetical protein